MRTLALKAYPQESKEKKEHLNFRQFLKGIENSQVRLNQRRKLGDADMTLDKALERALHVEAVSKIEGEDKDPPVSAIKSKENTQLVNLTYHLVRTLQTN